MLTTLCMRWQRLTGRESDRLGKQRSLAALIARAPLIATIMLGLAVAVQTADITFTLLNDASIGSSIPAVAVRGEAGMQGTAILAALNISRAHLFGLAPIVAATTSRVVSRAPLVLTGIIATGDPKDGFAILGASAANAHVFHTGSEAVPGVMLEEVYPQRVVVLRGGERMTLMLPRGAGGQSIDVRFARIAAGPPDEIADSGEEGASRPSPEDFKPPPMSNASTILRAFSLRPVSIGGERGLRIMGTGINANTLSALGLAPGDVIMQVNGVPIGSKNTPDISKVLSGGGGVTLVVNRDGGEASVTIDPAAAAHAADAYRQAAPDM